jgi:hypothetical protein
MSTKHEFCDYIDRHLQPIRYKDHNLRYTDFHKASKERCPLDCKKSITKDQLQDKSETKEDYDTIAKNLLRDRK